MTPGTIFKTSSVESSNDNMFRINTGVIDLTVLSGHPISLVHKINIFYGLNYNTRTFFCLQIFKTWTSYVWYTYWKLTDPLAIHTTVQGIPMGRVGIYWSIWSDINERIIALILILRYA